MTRGIGRIALAAVVLMGVASPASAQVDRIRRAAQREVDRTVDDLTRKVVRCALGDAACVEKARADGSAVVITDADGEVIRDADGNPVSDPQQARILAQQPGEGVWRNYDFVRGDTIWVATDFSDVPVGRFSPDLEHVRGNMQVVRLDSGDPERATMALEATSNGIFRLHLPAVLPESFTIEFNIRIPTQNISTQLFIGSLEGSMSRYDHDYISVQHSPGIFRRATEVSSTSMIDIVRQDVPVRVQVNGDYAMMYVRETRVAQVPSAKFPRADLLEFHMSANARFPTYIRDIIVAVGLDDLHDALTRTGRFSTTGILFDTDSNRLRPESTPVLEEILDVLGRDDAMRLAIVGHTDSQGEDAHNLDLSRRRAQAVVDFLVAHGVAASRLTSEGRGESEPVGDNATPEGRLQNRRVELLVADR